jgi:hypothetical protein
VILTKYAILALMGISCDIDPVYYLTMDGIFVILTLYAILSLMVIYCDINRAHYLTTIKDIL